MYVNIPLIVVKIDLNQGYVFIKTYDEVINI